MSEEGGIIRGDFSAAIVKRLLSLITLTVVYLYLHSEKRNEVTAKLGQRMHEGVIVFHPFEVEEGFGHTESHDFKKALRFADLVLFEYLSKEECGEAILGTCAAGECHFRNDPLLSGGDSEVANAISDRINEIRANH